MILLIDAQNCFHRARTGFKLGPAPIVFNFFRQFSALVKKFKPERVIFALEGRPEHRKILDPGYKANRVIPEGDPREAEMRKFFEQVDVIKRLLVNFPVTLMRHATSEADDVIANIVKNSASNTDFTIVSSDSDFIQLLDDHENVRLYNPVKDIFVEKTPYNYALWKSLCGDPTDCIIGLPGVGPKTAEKLASDPTLLEAYWERHPDHIDIFELSSQLIKFKIWSEEDLREVETSFSKRDWQVVRDVFQNYKFNSLTEDTKWEKFKETFDYLWE